MSTFDEASHPRVAGGQFRDKTNRAPAGELTADDARSAQLESTADAYEHLVWSARMEEVQWRRRVNELTVEAFMADAALHAPAEATAALFTTNDSGEGVELAAFLDANGRELEVEVTTVIDPVDFESASHSELRDLGFYDVDERSGQTAIALREPLIPKRTIIANSGNHTTRAGHLDAAVNGDGGFGSFLSAIARRNADAGGGLAEMNAEDAASLNRDFEAFASLMATKINNKVTIKKEFDL